MKPRIYLLLFLGGLAVTSLAAFLERAPGYMDAEYYYAGAQRLANGAGLTEPYLWNYLNNPSGLPQPAFAYWMPLAPVVSAAGLKLLPFLPAWWAARVPLILAAACVPPLAALMAFRLTRRRNWALLSGVFALLPGFYLAYLPTTDGFSLGMLLGGLFLLLASEEHVWLPLRGLGLGFVAGLMHLGRADGLIWLLIAVGVATYWLAKRGSVKNPRSAPRVVGVLLLTLTGYMLVMAPWYARNLSVWGTVFPPGSGRAAWITDYGQTMIYPAALLTPSTWLAAGWKIHLLGIWDAFLNNLQTTVAVQGGIILFPFLLVGMYRLRSCFVVCLGGLIWGIIFCLMTFVFPYSGMNGAFFHSGAALQPFLWSVAPVGIVTSVEWAARLRHWQRGKSVLRFLTILLVATGLLLTIGLFTNRVVGSAPGEWAWEGTIQHYREVESKLLTFGAVPPERVLVNDPPGYYLAAGREALVIPYGGTGMLLAAAQKYQVDYLVLEANNSPELEGLYTLKAIPPRFDYLGSVGDTRLFRIHGQ